MRVRAARHAYACERLAANEACACWPGRPCFRANAMLQYAGVFMRLSMPHLDWRRLLATWAVLAFAVSGFGIDVNSLQPEGYLSDFAHVVDAQSKQQIESYCYSVEHSLGVQVALVTIDTLDNRDIETVANQLFRHFGVGSKQGNQGVMLLLAVKDRKSRIETGYGIEPYLTDGFSGSILRSMRPELQAGNYGPALLTAAQAMAGQIAQGKGLAAPDGAIAPEGERAAPRQRSIPLPLILVGIFLLIWLFGRGGRSGRGGGGGFLTGMLMGGLLNSGRSRNWGGGGFGGWDSGGGGGGGFGGFGGGSSGGGGASSGW
jgi:uncharacterized protein